jgi:hypothetical protein
MASTTWAPAGPSKYGIDPAGVQPPSPAQSELHSMATPSKVGADEAKPWHPQNPLFWFAGILVVTTGLAAFSTNVRVGEFKAGLSAGDAS